MIYKGNTCDGCGKVFTEDDDIVVCPECATPQHRECYEKGDCCVNEHLHSDSYEWKSSLPQEEKKPEDAPEEEKEVETSPCPNCGYHNPKGTKQCKNCSMKLVVFGIDLADSIDDKKNDTENSKDVTKYEPPFTLGQGEGFEYTENEENKQPSDENQDSPAAAPTPEQIGQSVLDHLASSSYDSYQQSFVSGVQVKLLHALIGSNAYKYVQKFRKMDNGNKISFNWAAFFFSPYWYFYRKLYKPGIIFMTIYLLVSIAITPAYTKFADLVMPIAENPDFFVNMSEAALLEYMTKMSEAMYPVMAFSLVSFAVNLLSGFIANILYRNYTIRNAKSVIAAKTKTEATMLISKLGGISLLALMISYLAEQGISLIISNLMF